jgi:hypothetical protein
MRISRLAGAVVFGSDEEFIAHLESVPPAASE